jgi:hypothetical protein
MLHEYAHVFHSQAVAACGRDYGITNPMVAAHSNAPWQTIWAACESPGTAQCAIPPSKENGWSQSYFYAYSNDFEYFAVLTEAFMLQYATDGQTTRHSWPRTVAMLQTQDQQGFNAVRDFWKTSAADIEAAKAKCGKCSIWSDGPPPWLIALIIFVLLAGIATSSVLCKCCHRCPCNKHHDRASRGSVQQAPRENELHVRKAPEMVALPAQHAPQDVVLPVQGLSQENDAVAESGPTDSSASAAQ